MAPATRHVGPVDAGHRAGHAGRRTARRHEAARELGEALDVNDGPTALRFPKGDVGEHIPALQWRGGVDVLAVPADGLSDDVLLVAVGPFASIALVAAERLPIRASA
jgi:1-deoxy-D-xylulose-5-phosphate synthase